MPPRQATPEQAKEIKAHYQAGRGSIQDYARIYRLDMDEVLHIIGEEHLATVEFGGDQVDEAELGPTGRGMVNGPETVNVPYQLN